MNQPSLTSSVIPTWVDASLLKGMLRGIERESLRMQSNGFLSQKNHPEALGSALTHPYITTDYSEALMEFITTPQTTIAAALNELSDIHSIVHEQLEDGERLWPLSMPCMLDDNEENIKLAQYGSSNIGRFKTLYRRGLGVRYGRRMQTISGVHYNLSFPEQLFALLQQHESNPQLKQLSLQDYRSHRYFGLIRNFIRLIPLVMYMLGASPSVCRCFLTGRQHHLQPLVKGTLYLPEATALRMGRLGYQNSAQKELGIHYNDLHDYLDGLQKAVHTPYPEFTALGLNDEQGEPIQINDHVLQIENEYYSLVRPKQVPQAGETPSQALKNRGVGYVELRAVDVNPYSAIGIDEISAGFLESLALYCLLKDSPDLFAEEQEQIDRNQTEVVNRGRAADAKIEEGDHSIALKDWAQTHLNAIQDCAKLLDQMDGTQLYQDAIQVMQQRLDHVENTPSAHVIADTLQHGGTWNFGSVMAQQHVDHYDQHPLSEERKHYFEQLAQTSLQKQAQLEQDNDMSFEQYLAQYR
ncbi:glutamate-cysteine ligase [Acinetobacter colistiniresistens]|uniref:Glutamate--cysteine ligase n=1 Tax=Acinetobacter colistiniresistens TaxID=280145 RepID=N9PQV6_9GAMM|nr:MULTISPECIES: glutamate--cysteine ligase [Acinetobacter]ENX35954.1 glutamate-cysteine ligase [Acinetobacter colistiniresistens]EPG42732.1 glutamate-cysteine ligase [Acinetobacter colistiniresistens]TVT80313.1 glutamate--cysteine ligase [Acinetobacter colistiniresistens]